MVRFWFRVGVYSITAPSVLNLVLTLDGQNNPNSVFIIKVGGSFSTNSNAKVKLINGALVMNSQIKSLNQMATFFVSKKVEFK